jgi:hypothetical protein
VRPCLTATHAWLWSISTRSLQQILGLLSRTPPNSQASLAPYSTWHSLNSTSPTLYNRFSYTSMILGSPIYNIPGFQILHLYHNRCRNPWLKSNLQVLFEFNSNFKLRSIFEFLIQILLWSKQSGQYESCSNYPNLIPVKISYFSVASRYFF